MQDKTQQIFRDAPVPKAVLTNVIPSIISMLMVLVYNLADTFFIGQTKDPLMVAAVPLLHQHLLYSWLSVCYLELVVLL
jgi:multidrug efflux pump